MKTNDIVIVPIKKYTSPKYPTVINAKNDPDLLLKLPSRWEKNAKVVVAVSLIGAMTLTSCGVLSPKIVGYNPVSENYLNVAPVFIHGEGTGAMGCVMVAPPVFLSEQEALAVIKSVTEDSGLKFLAEPPGYIAANNKPEPQSQYSWENQKYVLGDGNIGMDLYDDKKGVAVTFISMEEAEIKYTNMGSSVTSYHPRELAELTAEDFSRQKGDIAVGVFYEPGMPWDTEEQRQILDEYETKRNEIYETYYKPYVKYSDGGYVYIEEEDRKEYDQKYTEAREEYEANMKLLIEKDLRAQIQDFIEWLQSQGII